jgi:dienelactone hydrolase
MTRTPTFHLPSTVLIDELVPIELRNTSPHQHITIHARMNDRFGQTFASHARFLADAQGTISTAAHAPVSGTYTDCDPTGLFWSMEPTEKTVADPTRDALSPLLVHVSAENETGETLATATLTRLFKAPDVTRISINENGLDGAWYLPAGEGPFPAVMVLGGSEGGLNLRHAAMLASHGFAALSLAYFGRENLPKYLVNIPLEYIKTGIDWIHSQPNICPRKLTIMGWSKGGELALLSAATFPEITAAVAYVPSGYIFSGLGPVVPGIPHSSWSYQGQPLPYADAEVSSAITEQLAEAKQTGEPLVYRDWYIEKLGNQTEREPYTIPVERINGPILLLTVGDDQLWPCDHFGEQILERLRVHNHPYEQEHFHAPDAGHSLSVVGMPTTHVQAIPYGTTSLALGGTTSLALGGTPRSTAHAQTEGWTRVLEFLRRHA